MTSREDDVVVTGLVPYGDADLIVRLFGREGGRTSAFARAARRSKKRFVGGLAPLSRGRVWLSSKSRGDLPILERSELLGDPDGLGADVVAFGRAAYLAELVEKLLPEREPAPEVFGDLVLGHERLSRGLGDASLLRAFELRLLLVTGYLPDLSPLEEPCVAYDPARGQLCVQAAPGTLPFDDAARQAAQRLLEEGLSGNPDIDEPVLRTVSRIFASHLRRMGVGELKSVAFLKSIS